MIAIPRELVEGGILFFGVSGLLYMFVIVNRVGRTRTFDDEVRSVGRGLWITMFVLGAGIICLLVPFFEVWDPGLLETIKQSRPISLILWGIRKITPLNHW